MNPSERSGIVVFRNEVPCRGCSNHGHTSCATERERFNHGPEYDEQFVRLHDAISKGFKMVLDELRSEDTESEDSDGGLTVRIWAEILKNLNATQMANARLVCHRWKRTIDRSPSLVGKFVLSFPQGTTLDKHCELVRDVIASGVQHMQASLRKVTLVGAAAWWPAVGGALVSLTIADCKIPIDMLLDVLKLSPSLKRLDLTCGKNLNFHTVKAVDFQLELLENLCLTDIQYVKTLDVFQQICPRLKVLRIPGRSKLAGFIDKLICFIKTTRRTLEEVAIGGGTDLWEKLSDLNGLLLKRATFAYVAPERMVILSRNVPSIESLSIDWMKFEDEKLAKIGDNLPKLKSLTARIASPATFLNFMPELAQLSLNCSNHFISFGELERHNLTSLTLQNTKLTDNWHRHFPNMRSVTLIKCNIDGSWSDLFLPVAQLGKLQHLLLYKVSVAVASDDVYIPDYLNSLSLLEIRKCRLPKATLHTLIRFCPMLVRIDLQRVQGVDDDIRLAIGEGLKYLKEINIDDCAVRDGEFLEHTSKHCEGVEANLTDCNGTSLSEVPVEEPKIKRAKKMAEDLNAEELRALLAAKLGNNPISNSGHEFVEIDPFLNVEVPDDLEQSEQRDSDDAGSEQGLIWQNGEDGQQDIEELNSSQASVVGFPMPLIIKKESAGIEVSVLEPKESGGLPEQDPVEQDQSAVATPPASGHGKKPLDEPRVPPAEEEVEDEIAGLKIKMEHKKTIIKDLKALNSKLTQENLEKDQLIFRLNKENFDLKDSKNIPRARFTTSPDINVTVEELEDFHGRTDTTGKFVGMLLVKLVGIAKLLTISVTGQPCRRFSKLRNADGTLAFPPKEKLDPKIYEFVADKVAERAAIKWGVENVKLIRAESKGEKIREAICWKINNLVKAEKSRLAREALEAGPSGVRQPEPGLEPET